MGDALLQATEQSWRPFVLVAGLLMIGAVVQSDGLFAALGARIERMIGCGPVLLLAALLSLEAAVTAVLNLDTAVLFLTPVILHAARQRDCDERPFLYGALFMANGASLLLPGSNLTNLIVLRTRGSPAPRWPARWRFRGSSSWCSRSSTSQSCSGCAAGTGRPTRCRRSTSGSARRPR